VIDRLQYPVSRRPHLIHIEPREACLTRREVDERIPFRHEEPTSESSLGNLEGSFRIVIRAATINLDWRPICKQMPSIGVVEHQVGQSEQLQTRWTTPLTLRLYGAVQVANPNIQRELGSTPCRVSGKCSEKRIVKPVRKVSFEFVEVHVGHS
jgi:hypothetical protein